MRLKKSREVYDVMMMTIEAIRHELDKDREKYQGKAEMFMKAKDHTEAVKMACKADALKEFADALGDADDDVLDAILKNSEGRE